MTIVQLTVAPPPPRPPLVYTGHGPDRDEMGHLMQCHGQSETPDCARCPAAKHGRPYKPVPAFGARRGLMIVGEGPSTEEIIQGHPFVGPSGHELNRVFRKYGIDRQLMWISNALICVRPYDDKDMFEAVKMCSGRLEAEMRWVEPRAILALGRTAMAALQLETTTIADARGTVQQTPLLPGVPVITSLHPAAILRGGAGEGSGDAGKQKMNMDAQMMFLEADIVKAHAIAVGAISSIWSDDVEVFVEPAPMQMPKFAAPPTPPAPSPMPIPTPAAPAPVTAVHRKQPTVPTFAPIPQEAKVLPVAPAPAPVDAEADEYLVDATCSFCGTLVYDSPAGTTCDNGHGGAPFNPIPEGAKLRPLPDWVSVHGPLEDAIEPVPTLEPLPVVDGADGVVDEVSEADLTAMVEACKKTLPGVFPALCGFAKTIGNRDVLIELMVDALREAGL